MIRIKYKVPYKEHTRNYGKPVPKYVEEEMCELNYEGYDDDDEN